MKSKVKSERNLNKEKFTIKEPILQQDYIQALSLIERYIVDKVVTLDDLKKLSSGEIFIAKVENQVVGVITARRPGKMFREYEEKYFSIERYEVDRKDVGYIELIAVNSGHRRKGIARQLLKKEINFQKEVGAKAIGVLAWQGSPEKSSQKFFTSFGFAPIATHKSPWLELSERLGPEGYQCPVCGNPCTCDDVEMIKYL